MTISRIVGPESRSWRLTGAAVAVVTVLGLAGQAAQAQSARLDPDAERTNVSVSLGAGSTDNVRRRSTGSESSTYKQLGTLLDIVRGGPRFNANVQGDVEYRDYSTSGLDSERVGVLDAELEVLAVPERFSWLFAGRGGQGRTDPFQVEGPTNREDVNIIETGPRLTFPLGDRTDVRVTATAGKRAFEVSKALDSDTTDVEAGLYRALSSTSEFGVIVSSRDVEYDVSQFDNNVERAYVVYSRRLASGSASFSVGSNRTDVGGTTESSPYVTADWQREVGTRSGLSVSLSNSFVDAGDNVDYDRLVFDSGAIDGNILLTQDVYENTSVSTAFTMGGTRTRFTISGGLSESSYQTNTVLDNDSVRLSFNAERQLTSRMELGFVAGLEQREFTTGVQEDKDKRAELWVEREFAGPFSGRLGYRRNSRSGTQTAAYDENTIMLSVQYDLNTRQVPEQASAGRSQ